MAHPKDKDAPLCKCGCGKQVRWSVSRCRYSEFVNGHNSNLVDKSAPHLMKKRSQYGN